MVKSGDLGCHGNKLPHSQQKKIAVLIFGLIFLFGISFFIILHIRVSIIYLYSLVKKIGECLFLQEFSRNKNLPLFRIIDFLREFERTTAIFVELL